MVSKILPYLLILFLFSGASRLLVEGLLDTAGQEIIEIRNPLKDVPTELEEEPSVERDDGSYHGGTITTQQAIMKKELKAKPAPTKRTNAKSKIQDDEEKIEKELDELYKDQDYKSDNDGTTSSKTNSTAANATSAVDVAATVIKGDRKEKETKKQPDKPIARANNEFKFQPDDINNKVEVERFRTSMDDIMCDRKFTTEKMGGAVTSKNENSAGMNNVSIILYLTLPLVAKLIGY